MLLSIPPVHLALVDDQSNDVPGARCPSPALNDAVLDVQTPSRPCSPSRPLVLGASLGVIAQKQAPTRPERVERLVPMATRPALERYRLATGAPRTAWGFQSRWRTVRGVATHDRCSVSAPSGTTPLVLLHGLAVSHRYLMPLAARLADHHPVHVVDLPGFGLSGDPGRVLDVAEHADHLADWLQAADLSPVAVLGNSFGCQVAVELAVRHPDRVRGLILVGPTVDPAARTASRQILRWLRDTAREDPLQLPILVRDVRDARLHRVVGTLVHALRDPIEDKLPLVRVPVLVTRGSREPIVPAAWAATATRLLPLGELAVVPGPHNANYGAADHLAALVLGFLHRRVQARGGQAG